MKVFEEWNLANYPVNKTIIDFSCHNHREDGWRAALEWLYTKLDYSQEHENIKDIIEEELNENL